MLFCFTKQRWDDYKSIKNIIHNEETKIENARIFFCYAGQYVSHRNCIEDTFFVTLKDSKLKKFLDFVLKSSLKNEFTISFLSQFNITSLLSNYLKTRAGGDDRVKKDVIVSDEGKIIFYLEYKQLLYHTSPISIYINHTFVDINYVISILKKMKISSTIDYRAKDLLLEILEKTRKEKPEIQFLGSTDEIQFILDKILYSLTRENLQLDIKYKVSLHGRLGIYDSKIANTDYHKKSVYLNKDEFFEYAFRIVSDNEEAKYLAGQVLFLLGYVVSLLLYKIIAEKTDEIIKFIFSIPEDSESPFLPVFDAPDARERAIAEIVLFTSFYRPYGPSLVKKVTYDFGIINPDYKAINPFVDKIFDFATKRIFEIVGTDFPAIYYNIQDKLSRWGVVAESGAVFGDPYRIHIYFYNKSLVLEMSVFSNNDYSIKYVLYRISPGLLENFFKSLGLNKKEIQHIQRAWLLDSFYRFIR